MSELTKHTPKLHERKYPDYSIWMFWCPGCKCGHSYHVPRWSFDRNVENPTFRPSLRLQCNDTADRSMRTVCHLHITNGSIEYCGDCSHELNGKTIPMEPFPENYGT